MPVCKPLVYMCKPHVNCQFTVNSQFTHRQRLSLHSRSLESYKADYMCKCGWIDIASARASAIEVYTCKLAVYTQAKTVLSGDIMIYGQIDTWSRDVAELAARLIVWAKQPIPSLGFSITLGALVTFVALSCTYIGLKRSLFIPHFCSVSSYK